MTLTLQPVQVAPGSDEEGMLVFSGNRLVAVLVHLSDDNEVAPNEPPPTILVISSPPRRGPHVLCSSTWPSGMDPWQLIEMPGGSMSGIQFAKVVRQRWPGVRIVITSGRAHPGPADDLPDDIAFLTKPFMPATVVNLLRRLITPQIIDPASSVA